MAILERIRRIAKGNITQWLNQVETPESEVSAKISELEEASVEAKNALAGFAVTYKRLEKQVQDLRSAQAELEGRALQALQAATPEGEGAARRLLAEKLRVEERIRSLEPVLVSRKETYDELKENLVEIHDQLNQARARLMDLRARKRAAEAEGSMGRQLDRVTPAEGLGFDRLEEEVLTAEARVEIDRELRGDVRAADDSRALREARVDAELAALKQKLNP